MTRSGMARQGSKCSLLVPTQMRRCILYRMPNQNKSKKVQILGWFSMDCTQKKKKNEKKRNDCLTRTVQIFRGPHQRLLGSARVPEWLVAPAQADILLRYASFTWKHAGLTPCNWEGDFLGVYLQADNNDEDTKKSSHMMQLICRSWQFVEMSVSRLHTDLQSASKQNYWMAQIMQHERWMI